MEELLRLAMNYGLGPMATVIGAAWYMMKKYNERRDNEHAAEIKIREAEVAAREKDNELRRMKIRLNITLLKFLKEQGYDVEAPDLLEEI